MKKFGFSLFLVILIMVPTLLIILTNKFYNYQLVFENLEKYKNQYLLFPKKIDFKPTKITDFEKHFQKTIYNFYFYLDQNYFSINDDKIWLKLI